jgi:hypothetical protein
MVPNKRRLKHMPNAPSLAPILVHFHNVARLVESLQRYCLLIGVDRPQAEAPQTLALQRLVDEATEALNALVLAVSLSNLPAEDLLAVDETLERLQNFRDELTNSGKSLKPN